MNYSSLLNLLSLQIVLFQLHSSSKAPFCSLYSLYISRTKALHFGSIRSTLVLFGQLCFYSVQFGLFSSIQSILSTLVLFSPCWSYSVIFSPFCPLRSNLVLCCSFGPIWSILYTLVLFGSFNLIRSTLVPFDPHWFYLIHIGLI